MEGALLVSQEVQGTRILVCEGEGKEGMQDMPDLVTSQNSRVAKTAGSTLHQLSAYCVICGQCWGYVVRKSVELKEIHDVLGKSMVSGVTKGMRARIALQE